MATRVLITIDTELVWRHHAAGLDWDDNFNRSYEAAGAGVPYQLEMLRQHGLKACFFVDPMPAVAFGLEPVRRMVEPILAAGQEVQLHLHPFWAKLTEAERTGLTAELATYGFDEQLDLIRRARELLIQAGAPAPIAFRAGSYAANADTLQALDALGFRYDSSHNGCHHPWPSALPLPPALVAPAAAPGGLIEVPVSQIAEGQGKLRHLQICAVTFREMRAALTAAQRLAHPLATIVSHSFELASRDGLRVNTVVRRRFDRLCEFLAQKRETLPTCWFGDLDALPITCAAGPPTGRSTLRMGRVASQLWLGSRYERPSESLTIATGSSMSSVEAFLPYVL
jgi:peptidoglycan/xylan/chitin deacetylase (PgdA/CDA1 family)